jgi:FAD/FMN-containing dehydrogenase
MALAAGMLTGEDRRMENFGGQADDETMQIREEKETGTADLASLHAVVEAAKTYRRALQNTKVEWTLAKLGDGTDRAAVQGAVTGLIDAQKRLFAALDRLPNK